MKIDELRSKILKGIGNLLIADRQRLRAKKCLLCDRACAKVLEKRVFMLIQEMRSGVELLRKRQETAEQVDKIFEMRSLLEPDLQAVAERFEREIEGPAPDAETQAEPPTEASPDPTQQNTAAVTSELERPMWAVVSFERIEVSRLTYAQAVFVMNELVTQGIAGLCILTDEAARRLKQG